MAAQAAFFLGPGTDIVLSRLLNGAPASLRRTLQHHFAAKNIRCFPVCGITACTGQQLAVEVQQTEVVNCSACIIAAI